MNILPLVSAFIILFAVGSYAFFHSMRAAAEEKFHYSHSLMIDRLYASQIQAGVYKSQKGKREKKEKKEEEENDDDDESEKDDSKVFISKRDNGSTKNGCKLNIKTLAAAQSNPLLEKTALALLKDIYEKTVLYKPGLEREILDILTAALKLSPSAASFEELLSKVPDSSIPLFYKLMKGTQQCKLHMKAGYPALGDYLTLERTKEPKPVNFTSASRPVLTAVFGEKITEQIIIQEKQKWEVDHKQISLTKNELEPFLMNKFQKNISDYEPLLCFNKEADKSPQEIVKELDGDFQLRINN